MRCLECGYQNEAGTTVCLKCGTKVSASSSSGSQATQPGPEANPQDSAGSKTMKGSASSQPAWDPNVQSQSDNFHRCPECGHYPLKDPASKDHPCLNCGYPDSGAAKSEQAAAPGPAQSFSNPSSNKTRRMEDMNIGEKVPVLRIEEVSGNGSFEFKGNEVEVGRSQLDPSNDNISSRHAKLSFENGEWHITDTSSNEATFIQVKGKTPVPSGTRIIIGNKIYKVEYGS